jgi:hypothetical protein
MPVHGAGDGSWLLVFRVTKDGESALMGCLRINKFLRLTTPGVPKRAPREFSSGTRMQPLPQRRGTSNEMKDRAGVQNWLRFSPSWRRHVSAAHSRLRRTFFRLGATLIDALVVRFERPERPFEPATPSRIYKQFKFTPDTSVQRHHRRLAPSALGFVQRRQVRELRCLTLQERAPLRAIWRTWFHPTLISLVLMRAE